MSPPRRSRREPQNCCCPYATSCPWYHRRVQGSVPTPLVGAVPTDDAPWGRLSCSWRDPPASLCSRMFVQHRPPPMAWRTRCGAPTGRSSSGTGRSLAGPPNTCSSVGEACPHWGSSRPGGWNALRRRGADQGCRGVERTLQGRPLLPVTTAPEPHSHTSPSAPRRPHPWPPQPGPLRLPTSDHDGAKLLSAPWFCGAPHLPASSIRDLLKVQTPRPDLLNWKLGGPAPKGAWFQARGTQSSG